MPSMPRFPASIKGLGVTFRTMTQAGAVTVQYPHVKEDAAHPGPGRHRPEGGELHRLHAVRPAVPRLVHLHRGPQGEGPAPARGRQAPHGQHARPLRHRLRALHVLRHLRRGVPVRRPVLEPRVRVLRAPHRRPAPRQGAARRVDGDGPRPRALEAGAEVEGEEECPHAADVVAQNIVFGIIAAVMVGRRAAAWSRPRTSCTPPCAWWSCWPASAGQFILLAAEFVAIAQVLVYIGAIVVLFLFGIMLTRAPIGEDGRARQRPAVTGLVVAVPSPACSARC